MRVYDELAQMADRAKKQESEIAAKAADLHATEATLEEVARRLNDGVSMQLSATDDTTKLIKEMTTAIREIAQHVETLTSSAEESSSSILEMTATNDEVAENVGELAGSVRETVSSIEEMAYSIKEVAKNVDALSLTAEETSSSMNEMDVSIDQVQSNANESARLWEVVALDAEKGAEAILKTISEIYRIKESSQEAVAVISNLGSRIEAIGQIVNVIDDVAEQTNLLALNAAIIAAQAGEQGKGFAVVADEIKDLAERAGASTREITDLIKTVQAESKNAIAAVERGAHNVDRGVEVSNEAERALKKILESSQKSTNMVRAIARATVEQAKGSKQVTDAIGRIAETVQQIAAATAQQARGSELIMKSAEKMRLITQHVERSSQEQARGGRQITGSIENISNMVNQLNVSHRAQTRGSELLLGSSAKIEESARLQETSLKGLQSAFDKAASRHLASSREAGGRRGGLRRAEERDLRSRRRARPWSASSGSSTSSRSRRRSRTSGAGTGGCATRQGEVVRRALSNLRARAAVDRDHVRHVPRAPAPGRPRPRAGRRRRGVAARRPVRARGADHQARRLGADARHDRRGDRQPERQDDGAHRDVPRRDRRAQARRTDAPVRGHRAQRPDLAHRVERRRPRGPGDVHACRVQPGLGPHRADGARAARAVSRWARSFRTRGAGSSSALIAEVARDGHVREDERVLGSRDMRDPTRAVSIKVFPLPDKHTSASPSRTSPRRRSRGGCRRPSSRCSR